MIQFDPRVLLVAGHAVVRDVINRVRFGDHAPKVAETIWVRPADVERYICEMPPTINRLKASGRVIDFAASNVAYGLLDDTQQMRACRQRWCDQIAWDQTGEFAATLRRIKTTGRAVRVTTEEGLRGRYRILDEIYDEVSRTGILRTQKQRFPYNFREYGSIQVAIDPEGRPVLGKSGGFHRLALAKILGVDVIPAEIGLVDVNAIDKLDQYRVPPIRSGAVMVQQPSFTAAGDEARVQEAGPDLAVEERLAAEARE